MTSLAKVFRTTAFKLSAIYIAVFSIFSVAFVLYISYSTNFVINEQLHRVIAGELYTLADEYRSGGLAAVVETIDQRARQPGASLYLVTDLSGRVLAGNVARVPADILNRSGVDPLTVSYERYTGDPGDRTAMIQVVRLPGGYRMLVGRDIGERDEFRQLVGRALAWALALLIGLALLSWVFVSRRVLKRIDSVSATSRQIMQGDLSGRLEVTGTGDEFDRLAEGLNAMLVRIESLMYGLKDVSDNIAHDLKTPLNRLRNRVETALAGPADTESYRAALEATIAESDDLIKTFNALLIIARIEAGSPDGAAQEVDANAIVCEVVELYEPAADENGIRLEVDAPRPVMVKASRELLGQALANLLDNAIKHGEPQVSEPREADAAPRTVKVSTASADGTLVLTVADNGPGIPAADRERVLERFVRLEKSRSRPGSGLGLSLVAAVVGLHDGTITLADNDPGLVVTIRLPIA